MNKDMIREPTTNEKTHNCLRMPGGSSIDFKGKDYVTEHHSGFELTLYQTKKEGKLTPKTYSISYMVDYCPFCGEKLISKSHKPECECNLCEVDNILQTQRREDII